LAIWHQLAYSLAVRNLSCLQRKSPTTIKGLTSDESKIIHFWTDIENVNNAAWIVPLLVALVAIQYFGVRGYGEVGAPAQQIISETKLSRLNSCSV
jgi:hypothetical protein